MKTTPGVIFLIKKLHRGGIEIRGKILPAFCLVFCAWFAVSVYFYCQHYRIVKKYSLNEEVRLENGFVRFKEITIANYEPSKRHFERSYDQKVWYWEIGCLLPVPLQKPFFYTCYFYSRPYDFNNEYGAFSLKGLAAFKNEQAAANMINLYDIYVYNEDMNYFGRGNTFLKHGSSNVVLLNVQGKNAPFSSKRFKIVIKNEDSNEIKAVEAEPAWEVKTYNFFSKRVWDYEFDPILFATEFAGHLRGGEIEKARDFIKPEERAAFPLSNLRHRYWKLGGSEFVNFEGDYKQYRDVFSVSIVFAQQADGNGNTDFREVAEQKIYFVEEGDKAYVIDADPVVELSRSQ